MKRKLPFITSTRNIMNTQLAHTCRSACDIGTETSARGRVSGRLKDTIEATLNHSDVRDAVREAKLEWYILGLSLNHKP